MKEKGNYLVALPWPGRASQLRFVVVAQLKLHVLRSICTAFVAMKAFKFRAGCTGANSINSRLPPHTLAHTLTPLGSHKLSLTVNP